MSRFFPFLETLFHHHPQQAMQAPAREWSREHGRFALLAERKFELICLGGCESREWFRSSCVIAAMSCDGDIASGELTPWPSGRSSFCPALATACGRACHRGSIGRHALRGAPLLPVSARECLRRECFRRPKSVLHRRRTSTSQVLRILWCSQRAQEQGETSLRDRLFGPAFLDSLSAAPFRTSN